MLRMELLDYKVVLEQISDGRSHLLLGNGFSIACDPRFTYRSLYSAAVDAGLSRRAQAVFERLGTNNFEGIMRLLDDTHWVASVYGLVPDAYSEMLGDLEIVKKTLVEAVASSHLEHTGLVAEDKKAAARRFLAPYHNIFTTNYDLLLYWVVMSDPRGPAFEDGFRADPDDPDAPYLIFSERLGDTKGLFYLHGALHLYLAGGELRKHSWARSGRPLTDLIRTGLTERQYPLFVAEGSPEKKLEQISTSGYLSYCLGKLGRVHNRVVVYGHGLGSSDRHITQAVSDNTDLKEMFVGLYGDPNSPANQDTRSAVEAMIRRREKITARMRRQRPLEVHFFDSASATVWGDPGAA